MQNQIKSSKGFTLIELLVVIAIIAILAAILFPVFGQVRERTRQNTCMSQMHRIWSAAEQYRIDNNRFPKTLYGYVELPNRTYYNGVGTPVKMDNVYNNSLKGGQKYLNDVSAFICPDNNDNSRINFTTAFFPKGQGVFVGQAPNFNQLAIPAWFYKSDSYDVGPQIDVNGMPVKDGSGNQIYELHYSTDWTGVKAGPGDNPNQLKYPNYAPDKTILTWCTYHAAIAHSNVIPAIMANGTVKPLPIRQFVTNGPLGVKY